VTHSIVSQFIFAWHGARYSFGAGDLRGPAKSACDSRQAKENAEKLAAMIHHDLSQIEGCPQRGLKVTVYGLNPWNVMLTFGVEAGPVPNKADLQALFDVITERLKRLYDV
jgi:hypothetical protein